MDSRSEAVPRVEYPKDFLGNLEFRKLLYRLGKDPADRAGLLELCRRDVLFFFNCFLWTYNPRIKKGPKWLPFLTWEFQDKAILKIVQHIEDGEHLAIEKSRDMGATVMILGVMLWRVLFHDDEVFLLGSNKQETVDKAGNHKALFQKLDSFIERLPQWMSWPIDLGDDDCRTKNNLRMKATGGAFDGEATVANFGRGDRRTAVMLDEFAEWLEGYRALTAVYDVTDCVIANSTHQGSQTAFYDACCQKWEKLTLHWTQHPLKARGLYYKDGKPRSPWYDKQCKVRLPKAVKQEIDIDVQGAAGQFFDPVRIAQLVTKARSVFRVPVHTGKIHFDRHSLTPQIWEEDIDGPYKLWFRMGPTIDVPEHKYVISGDVSLGTGNSNSVAAIWDIVTLERIGEFVSRTTSPSAFGEIMVMLSRMFRDAIVIWDRLGPGRATQKRMIDVGFRNLWYPPKNPDDLTPKRSMAPGFVLTPAHKKEVFEEYARALYFEECTNWSVQALEECLEFVETPNGPSHSKALMRAGNVDAEGENHGDFVIADTLAWHVLKNYSKVPQHVREEQYRPKPGIDTFAGRRLRWEESQLQADTMF